MAKEAKKKDPEFRTPRGTWRYPKVDKPDYGTKDYPKKDGEYSIQHVLKADAKATKELIAKLQPLYKEAEEQAAAEFKKLKVETRKKLGKVTMNPLFETVYDQETEKPTGDIVFKFKMKAGGERKDGTKWTAKPRVFDAKGAPITKVPEIWGGSEGIVAFSARSYFIPGTGAAGLSLKLLAAQLLKLVQGGGRDASGYGFGAEEGGYEYSNSDQEDETESQEKDEDTTEEDQSDGDTSSSGGDEDF